MIKTANITPAPFFMIAPPPEYLHPFRIQPWEQRMSPARHENRNKKPMHLLLVHGFSIRAQIVRLTDERDRKISDHEQE